MAVFLRTVGSNRVANKYRTLISRNKEIFDPEVRDHAKAVQRDLSRRKYPSRRPNQKYIRTGRLGSSYSAVKISSAIWALKNSADYSQWVVDEETQTEGHRKNKWYTVQAVERQYRPQLHKRLTARARKHIGE